MKRYLVEAYVEPSMKGLVETLETDDWSEVKEFIWRNCQNGFNCQFHDLESVMAEGGEAFAKDFNENTVDVEEIIYRYEFM